VPEFDLVQKIAIWALPVLFAITLHEVAHGWAALKLGDPTAKMLGRLSLNPIKHIDPMGTVVVPLVMLLLPGGFLFGWAKPVPVSYANLRNPKRDSALVAAAGPLANLAMALLWALFIKLVPLIPGLTPGPMMGLTLMGQAGIVINVVLMVLNLLPLPPLDGGRVLMGLVPNNVGAQLARIEPYGFIILVGLLVTGVLGTILSPAVFGIMQAIAHVMAWF